MGGPVRSRNILVPAVAAAGVILVALLAWNFTRSDDSSRVQYWDRDMPSPEEMTVRAALSRASDRVGFRVRVPREARSGFMLNAVTVDFAGESLADLDVDSRIATVHFADGRGHALQVDQLPPGALQPSAAAMPLEPPAPGVEAHLEPPGFPGVVTITWISPDAAYLARYTTPGEQPPADAAEILLAALRSMR